MLGEEEGAWEGKKAAGRKEEARGQARLPLDRDSREVESSGPVAGSDPQPKQTYLRGLGGHSFPTQMESKANRNPAGPSCDPCPQTQQDPLTPPPISPDVLSSPKESPKQLHLVFAA